MRRVDAVPALPGPPVAISFDFWHTLVAPPDGLLGSMRREAVVAALIEHEVEVDDDVLDAHLAAAQELQAEAWGRGEHFEPARAAAHLADAIEGLGRNARSCLVDGYLGAGRGVELELSPGAAETVAALAGAGVQLGIVCDVGVTESVHLRAALERAGVLRHFRGWAFSDEVGHYKPSAEIFRHMLDQFALGEGDVVWHVGDLRRTDVAGARVSGLVPIRYRGLNDDNSDAPEADLVIDALSELVALRAAA
ncbi:MAG TPA: HAD family hydrolase [Solirubrobacterales bacterium]|jgi:putative hydrolase of the HAD superfamily|nr:HAD family hydrolase [Solirubrobacterales bacterium]